MSSPCLLPKESAETQKDSRGVGEDTIPHFWWHVEIMNTGALSRQPLFVPQSHFVEDTHSLVSIQSLLCSAFSNLWLSSQPLLIC